VIYDKKNVIHYRSRNAIFSEEFILPSIVEGEFYAIFHARKASRKETVSTLFSHPFLESSEREIIFLAHNGYVNEGKLREKLGFNGSSIDSELIAKVIAKYGTKDEVIGELKDITVSALNLLILKIYKENGKAGLYYINYYKCSKDYYQMYLSTEMKGRAVFSSTLLDYGVEGVPVRGNYLIRLYEGQD
jgi:predicted glutamine amidotransferase